MHAKIQHPKDVEYFSEYPAPLMEMMQAQHFTNINSTITFFGPMLYFLLRELGAEQVLEIGHAEGYTAFYLANAVRDNAIRYGMKDNKYYGIDIIQTEKVREALKGYNLPVDIQELDSMNLKPDTFPGVKFDVIFQDGCHDTEHVLYELKTMYPQLKGEGKGYWIFHDCFGPSEEAFQEVMRLIRSGVYMFEFCRFFTPYGLAIMRKMEGWDESGRYWTP
jgi:protein-L-isoaspartate O-methyltransferase